MTTLNMLNQVRGGSFCFYFNFYLCTSLMLGDTEQRLLCQFVQMFLWQSELTGPIFSIYVKVRFSDSYSLTAYYHIYFYYISP